MPVPPAPVLALRVGVEYLPPERPGVDLPLPGTPGKLTLSDGPSDSLDPLAGPVERTPVQVLPPREPIPDRPSWRREPSPGSSRSAELVESIDLSRERIARVKDTSERMGLRFLREVLGPEHRRVQRSVGALIMTSQFGYLSPDVPMTYVDERYREGQQLRMKRYGTRLLRKPARRALKELSIVSSAEKALDEFKAVHIPLSGSYQRRHNKSHRGRFSMHLGRGSESADRVEIYYLRSGWKIGSGPNNARVLYSKYLTDKLRLKLRSSFAYADQDVKLLGTLAFQLSPQTTVNLSAGNDMTVLTGPQTYLGTPPVEERSQAIAFYVEHMF